MSGGASDLRFLAPNTPTNAQLESTENEFENLMNSIHFPPPRTPLNTIPDPSQVHREFQEWESDSKDRFGAVRAGRPSDRKAEISENLLPLNKLLGNGSNCGTPRASGRGKAQSEPSSAQSTPARSGSRTLNGGVVGACSGCRPPPYSVGKGGSSTRIYRGISNTSEPLVEVPHFDLVEDPSFWTDHNVQVLIRIRPLSSAERALQGYGRCLKQESSQTLLWVGHPETRFTFDHIASEKISQEKLFSAAGLPMVENCLSGYNSCMFAYGQTGSGKTYTMMGEIYEIDGELNEDRGITPRIFEYLFTRIRAEEENRRDEKLKHNCKCSFLEIYNEQITDLLEPSSTNLQLREDLKKGVYVENLTEYHVSTVGDVVKLLLQGAANRKMAATCMNSESSRSHSVFTCNIESHWEKDSMTHNRFARLNLVDLAGSERQKTSGAEGDRLKEAANINKSLSTLGLVIMSLVDLAHGKHRHVPYRDSRLTFLLQDSLGGNSKTTIIANVSPSTCSASETLSTLKFAQRAKLIQNNAKVNEDASGDVMALQRQIQQLKGQLSFLMNHHNLSRPLSHHLTSFEESRVVDSSEGYNSLEESIMINNPNTASARNNEKVKSMEAALVGALRREKLAENAVQRLEAEIECMNRLADEKEEDVQRTKMMIRFREEKIKRLELLSVGSMSADKYLMEENKALLEEIQLLQSRIETNPELTRFALENIRLLEQLRLFQNFYEKGERDALRAEVSGLRDQLLETLEAQLKFASAKENQDMDSVMELEDCKKMNSKLIREVEGLHAELRKYLTCSQSASDSVTVSLTKDPEDLKQADKCSLVETILFRSDSGEEVASYDQAEYEEIQKRNNQKVGNALVIQHNDIEKELKDARMLIEAMESEQLQLIEELHFMQEENRRCMKILSNNTKAEESVVKLGSSFFQTGDSEIQMGLMNSFKVKLDKTTKDLERVRLLNNQYQEQHASKLCHEQQVELVREQVETETTRTILHLQEEVTALQLELHEKICGMTEENLRLRNRLDAKENEIKALCGEWEKATLELTNFLVDGSKSLKDASSQIESMASSFPQVNIWISEHVEKAAKVCIEKEETILVLQKSLEDAQKMAGEMELKLSSLKGAAIALTEIQRLHNDGSGKEALQLSKLLDEKINMVRILETKLKRKEVQIFEAENCTNAAFLLVKKLSDHQQIAIGSNFERDVNISELAISPTMCGHETSEARTEVDSSTLEDMQVQVQVTGLGVLDLENVTKSSYSGAEQYLTAPQTRILEASSLYRKLVQELMKDIDEIRNTFLELKEDCKNFQVHTVESEPHKFLKLQNQYLMLHQVREELDETNGRLDSIKDCIIGFLNERGCSTMSQDLTEAGGWSPDCYDSSTYRSSVASKDELDGKITEHNLNLKFEGGKVLPLGNQTSEESNKLLENSIDREATIRWLRMELEIVFNAFNTLYVQLVSLFNEKEIGNCSHLEHTCFLESLPADNNQDTVLREGIDGIKMEGMKQVLPSCELRMGEAETSCSRIREAAVDEIISHASRFLSKFEEAHTTIKEADFMLNALLKENENAKQLTGMWKQAGEEWLVEKASLIKEVEQLKSLLQLKEGDNAVLQDHIHCSLAEMEDYMVSLEGAFLQVQNDVEDKFGELYTDVISTREEILYGISNSRTSLEDIYSEILGKEFALLLYHCHIRENFQSIIPGLNGDHDFLRFRRQECNLVMNDVQKSCSCDEDSGMINSIEGIEEGDRSAAVRNLKAEFGLASEKLIYENLSLKKELERKEVLLKGLLFDFSLLQESASNKKDIKDETEKLIVALSQVRHELEMKTSQLDDLLVQHRKLEGHLADTENALFISISDLEQAKESLDCLSDQNSELRVLLKDLYIKKSEAEDQLEEQKDVIKGLEKEILRLTSSVEKKLLSSVEHIEDKLSRVTKERDALQEEVCSLKDKLEMAYALADENEAIAVEARQESEASKIYAEQKEEEVKILEHSVEELECTINVLEKKVCEMDEEVERHRLIRNSLELELQALRQRMLTVESFNENTNVEQTEDQLSRQPYKISLELNEAHTRIRILEEVKAEREKEIKQCKDYISELVLHAEAQAIKYQQKYKTLEDMVREVKTDSSNSVSATPTQEKTEKSTMRTRGSSSPFRCITGLVQKMNMEKDQELSMARLRIEELEELAANKQKEVCMLNTRLAAADSMTHDVIRDLLGVKLDITNYADLIDQHQVLKLFEEAQQLTEESAAKEQEICNLKKQIDDLIEERESNIMEISSKKADILASQMTVEQLQERDHLLTAQNEMLKMDKTNLKRRIAELDEMVKKLFGSQNSQREIPQATRIKARTHQTEGSLLRLGEAGITKRLANSQKLLSRVNDELAQYRRSEEHPSFMKYRKQKGPI